MYEQFFINPVYQLIESSLKNTGIESRSLISKSLKTTVITIAEMFGGKYSQRKNIIKFSNASDDVLALAEKALGNFAEQIDYENKRIILNPTYGRAVA